MRPQGSIQKPGTSPRISGSSPTAAGMAGSPKKVRIIDTSCGFVTSFPCVTPLFDGACKDNVYLFNFFADPRSNKRRKHK